MTPSDRTRLDLAVAVTIIAVLWFMFPRLVAWLT